MNSEHFINSWRNDPLKLEHSRNSPIVPVPPELELEVEQHCDMADMTRHQITSLPFLYPDPLPHSIDVNLPNRRVHANPSHADYLTEHNTKCNAKLTHSGNNDTWIHNRIHSYTRTHTDLMHYWLL
ncbi:unnamed protein product [Dicrocoelium dendriticum]|nr:unnamed protein product [Dicrocoelium dendriticum]